MEKMWMGGGFALAWRAFANRARIDGVQ